MFTCVVSGQESIMADQTEGCDSMTVLFTLNTSLQLSDYSSVSWDFGDGDTASGVLSVTHTYTSPGTYTVLCLLDGNNEIREDDMIMISQSPYADFAFKDSSMNDAEYKFFFQSNYYRPYANETISYEWRFHDGTGGSDSTAIHTYPAEGVYDVFLKLTSDNACSDSVLKKIPVYHELMPPNVFSPNGDALNDYFEVTTQGDHVYSFRVFTRTGTQVHYSNSQKIIWDGRTAGGNEVPEGVYFYVIESSDTPVETRISGFVHLYR